MKPAHTFTRLTLCRYFSQHSTLEASEKLTFSGYQLGQGQNPEGQKRWEFDCQRKQMCWSYFRHWCSFPSQSRARHSSSVLLCSRSRAGFEYAWPCCTRSVTSHPTDQPVPCLTWQGKEGSWKELWMAQQFTVGVRNSLISSSSTFT